MVYPGGVDEEVEAVLAEIERAEGVGDRTVRVAVHGGEDGISVDLRDECLDR